MPPDIFNRVPFYRVSIEHLFQHIPRIITDLLRTVVLSSEYLLVECGSIGVFEGQVAADHGEEDDAAGPDVDVDAVLGLAGHHFRRGLAGTAAGCLQHLALFLGVRQAEVHYFDVVSVVQEQVFGFEVSVHYS